MKLKEFTVVGLLGRKPPLSVQFFDDLNLVTGRNGAGKTTFLKLLWYIISGNITQAVSEIDFDYAVLECDLYSLKITKVNDSTCKGEIQVVGKPKRIVEDEYAGDSDPDLYLISDARDVLSRILRTRGSSVFFPTFRRIEGGFSTFSGKNNTLADATRNSKEIEEAMSNLSRRMSQFEHTFVSSISTVDIESLLLQNYAVLSERYTKLQQSMSTQIIETIRDYKGDYSNLGQPQSGLIASANEVIDEVQRKIEQMETERTQIMAPMSAVQKIVFKLFKHSGIRFGKQLKFGEAASAINSEVLSAGEKQMLSFICYNAFKRDSTVFIDEPELSLHVDWQRSLFPTLLAQESGNQFIIATHSPFIYAKYPDKEICIDADDDRGDSNGEGSLNAGSVIND